MTSAFRRLYWRHTECKFDNLGFCLSSITFQCALFRLVCISTCISCVSALRVFVSTSSAAILSLGVAPFFSSRALFICVS